MKTYCPFCREKLFSSDEYGDLWLCSKKHYYLYYYMTSINNEVAYQERILFGSFELSIEHPDNEFSIFIEITNSVGRIYNIEPFVIDWDYEALKEKIERYIIFI